MTEAKSLLKKEIFQNELKPCREVLGLICRTSQTNSGDYTSKGLTPTAIAQKIYEDRYEELDKQFETEMSNINYDPLKVKELKKSFSRKKKLPMQVISRKCKTLLTLKLICENTNPGKGSDSRKTFYYTTQLGLDINNILNDEGFPLINMPKKTKKGKQISNGSNSKIDYTHEYAKVQHSINLNRVLETLLKGFPETSKSGIYIKNNDISKTPYLGKKFEVEQENKHLYNDFFKNHLMFDKNLLKKIDEFKLKSTDFWKNKNGIFEEMLLDLNNYFSSEISQSSDLEPLDGNIRDWIYKGTTYLVKDDNRIFKEYFLKFNLEKKTIKGDWGLGSKKNGRIFSAIDIFEYSVRSYRFITFTTLDEKKITKSDLENKLKNYMRNLQQRPYYPLLIKNRKLLQEITDLKDEIKDILKQHSLLPIQLGDCEYTDPSLFESNY